MRKFDGKLIHSATDLINFVECPHLTAIDLAVVQGRLDIEANRTDSSDLVASKGEEHEAAYLESLLADGKEVVTIAANGALDLDDARDRTIAAMRDGAEVIFQSALYDGTWTGYADFLERVDRPSDLGSWSYEVADTKLARKVKPYFLLQLCFYTDLITQIQGAIPEQMHVVLGTGERASFTPAEFLAYHRRVQQRYLGEIAAMSDTYPHFTDHCGLCRWSEHCDAQRIADDYLGLVAWMRRDQIVRLGEEAITTMAGLAAADPSRKPARMMPATFDNLHLQAGLQVEQRETGEHSYKLLEPEPGRGFALLPKPSAGRPLLRHGGRPVLRRRARVPVRRHLDRGRRAALQGVLGHDRADEKRAFEDFMDFVAERRRVHPDLHVYHYAPYEPTALKRLMGLHATREDALDDLLRDEVLVDLFAVVRQGMRISQPSYSIKKVEAFYMPEREAAVTDGEDSIVEFERWLDDGRRLDPRGDRALQRGGLPLDLEAARLAARAPRGSDARARRRRSRGVRAAGAPTRRTRRRRPSSRRSARRCWPACRRRRGDRRSALADGAAARLPPPRGEARLVGLLRAARAWTRRSCGTTPRRSPSSSDVGGRAARRCRIRRSRRSTRSSSRAGAQDRARRVRSTRRRRRASTSSVSTTRRGRARDRPRDKNRADEPLPRALIPGTPYDTREQRKALQRIGADVAARGMDAAGHVQRGARRPAAPAAASTAVAAGALSQDEGFDLEHAKRGRRRARRQLPLHPGPARVGQDLHRRAPDPAPARAGQARRRDVEQPQGDQQAAAARSSSSPPRRTRVSSG